MNPRTQFMRALIAASMISLAAVATGCGEVVIFGHVVREGTPASKTEPESTAASQSTSSQPAAPRSVAAESSAPAKVEVQKVKAVAIVLTADALASVKEDSKFNIDSLLTAIKTELHALKVLDESNSQVTASGEIAIDEYALHPTTNAILFGKILSAGTLNGTLRVRDAQGNELSNRRIEAHARLSIPAEGEIENALGPLYRQFAIETGNTITGMPTKPSESTDWRPR